MTNKCEFLSLIVRGINRQTGELIECAIPYHNDKGHDWSNIVESIEQSAYAKVIMIIPLPHPPESHYANRTI